jgi:hypothetical protein
MTPTNRLLPATSTDTKPNAIGASNDDSTGLPWPRRWPGVYALVIASFVLWVVLLIAFESIFS